MSDIRLEMTISNVDRVNLPGDGIRVRVEYDDGFVAYAEMAGTRCLVSTDSKSPRWEKNIDGKWEPAFTPMTLMVRFDRPHGMGHSVFIATSALERAANAGLVAAGAKRAR